MELKNMKMSKEEQSEQGGSMVADAPEYPYGLQIQLDEDGIAKLGLPALPQVGQTMMITARVKVTSVSQYDSGDGPEQDVALQITDMAVGPDQKSLDPTKIYDGG